MNSAPPAPSSPRRLDRWESVAIVVLVLAVYLAVTPRTGNAYRHYVYLAMALLDGRLDVDVPPQYHDVIALNERTYLPFPPVPALVLLPAVAVARERTDMGRIGQGLAALSVGILAAALRRLGFPAATRLFCAGALAFGSVLWPVSAIGTTWFFAQEVVVLATALLVFEIAGRADPLVAGGLTVAAWLSRLSVAPAVPALAALLAVRHRSWRPIPAFLAMNAAGLLIYLGYNYLRFGDPLQTGYALTQHGIVGAEALARWGFFHVRHVPEHLHAMFFRAPMLVPDPPFLQPLPSGMALIFTSPVMVRLLFASVERGVWLRWGAVILSMAIPMLFFFSSGWVQFGYRYSLDWWVFALVLLAYAVGPIPRPIDYALLGASVMMNAFGAYWVRAAGW